MPHSLTLPAMESNIETYELGSNDPAMHTTFPLPLRSNNWDDFADVLPFPAPLKHSGIKRRLDAIGRPHALQGDASPAAVNAFLRAVNQAFPRGPADGQLGGQVGPRTVERELAGATAKALHDMFEKDGSLFAHTSAVVGEMSSAISGALVLAATAPNLTWAKSHAAKDMNATLSALKQSSAKAAEVRARLAAAQEQHQAGTAEWHDVVVYLRRKITFVYDPSAVRVNATSDAGRTMLEQLRRDSPPAGGYDARMPVQISAASEIWRAGFRNSGGRFGKPGNAGGA